MLDDRTLAFGEEITTALLGVDALIRVAGGDHDDGLIVVNMSTTHQPEHFASYAEARQRFADLRLIASALPEPDRALYYGQLCESTLACLRWRESGLSFEEQLTGFLHVPAEPVSDATLDALRSDMCALLTGLGFAGDLATQCAAWEERHRVPPTEVPDVLSVLLDEAWDRTAQHFSLPAPKSDGMRVQTVTGVPFNARCDYMHRAIELNIDPVLTRPALKHLAVHECYPGHYVQFKLRETWYRQGDAAADCLLSIVNSASSCIFEGIADNGLRVLDWLDDDNDRFSAIMTRYRAGIGTAAAWRLHALGWSQERVADWLRSQSLVGGEGWVANRMRFIVAPQRSVLIWSYWWGEPEVAGIWERQPPARQPEFLRFLYGRMHSPQSLALFDRT